MIPDEILEQFAYDVDTYGWDNIDGWDLNEDGNVDIILTEEFLNGE